MSITSCLLRILGRRAFVTFGLVTFLVSALLATVNVTSRDALKEYVEDQLSRIPWDLAIYQRGGITGREKLPAAVARVEGITDVESFVFLRARFPEGGGRQPGRRQTLDRPVDVTAGCVGYIHSAAAARLRAGEYRPRRPRARRSLVQCWRWSAPNAPWATPSWPFRDLRSFQSASTQKEDRGCCSRRRCAA